MNKAHQQEYRMSFTTGGLFLNESVALAQLHIQNEPWKTTIERALVQGTTYLPKTASNRRTMREISNRLQTLTHNERCFLVENADRTDQQALLWLATCRAYRFVREFVTEIIQERLFSYQIDLPLETFDILLNAKAEWNEDLAKLSQSTRLKLRQILFRIMREAGILSHNNRIQTAILSPRLRTMIEDTNPAELAFFPGIVVNRI